ncbi:Uncharacterised protein [Mycobacterium tuberculosis]|uniref:Uncharacterized protein n=1 Tax=Mycobacterium tuberculosis TaxID=1773 RepID=A0A654TFZ0_MYCTX|nr:Uncharacterised protein [Mycobacterium tuberculosis]CFE46759.1 Uncharacterised protein [Mycobacterium tuberculosis]CFS57051.1 Uncharacterised protein [Mycobacterium tuberculosis]COU95839.1 Uncharacterised protein [Mycobacterium tuberculosis]COV60874.1 Uncharacterised protein [Mycobacterium tuberculosis]
MPRPGLTGTSLANRERTSLASSTAAKRSSIRDPKPLRTGGRSSDSRSAVTTTCTPNEGPWLMITFTCSISTSFSSARAR